MRNVTFELKVNRGAYQTKKGVFHQFATFDEVDGSTINVALIEDENGYVHEIPLDHFKFNTVNEPIFNCPPIK